MFAKPGRRRTRDGWRLLSSSERRRIRKGGGLTVKQLKRVNRQNRAYKKGKLF